MRPVLVLLVSVLTASISSAADLSAKDLVAQLYQAHRSKHDPLDETQLLGRYFDAALLKLYLKDQREAKGEVGRLDGDPLYNAQDIQIKDLRSLALAGRVCLPDVNCRSATGRLRFNAGNGRSRNAGHGSFQEPR